MHHIISDGWSMGIFFKEVSVFYNAYYKTLLEGAEFSSSNLLPILDVQYADFALWQRKWLQGEVLEQQLGYWKKQLTGIPSFLELVTDRPRPKELSYKGSTYYQTLSKELKNKIYELSQEHQASVFMTLLAIFQILLFRYSGQKDIVVGSPIANRHYRETEGLIGFFVNTLALRTVFDEGDTFIDVLNRVKETTLEAYQHQDVPFEQLVEHLEVERTLNRNPIFQVMFTIQNATDQETVTLEQVEADPIFSGYSISKFDLSVWAFEREDSLRIGFEYATDIFDESTIERLGQHFEELIKEIIKDKHRKICEVSFLTVGEKEQLLSWNDTKVEYPKGKCIHQLFEEQVEENKDRIAVVYEEQQLTYEVLNKKANQLGHYPKKQQVVPETLIGICLPRGLDLIIGLFGILKSGGVYVPLDPEYPNDRLNYILKDAGIRMLLTTTNLKDQFKNYKGMIICLDKKEYLKESLVNLNAKVLSGNLAYVIYTSGSTGETQRVLELDILRLLTISKIYVLRFIMKSTIYFCLLSWLCYRYWKYYSFVNLLVRDVFV